MPYDGDLRKFTETQPDVFSLEGLIAWLEQQPGGTEYCWASLSSGDNGGCLIHRYLGDNGQHPGQDYLKFADCLAPGSQAYALDIQIVMAHPRTYAAALTRARELAGAS